MRYLLILLAACGDSPLTFSPIAGAPQATSALAFDHAGNPIAIGGALTIGSPVDAHVQRLRGATWEQTTTVPAIPGGLLFEGEGGKLVAAGGTAFRLDDESAFTWTPMGTPAGTPPNVSSIVGSDASGALYGVGAMRGVFRWTAGTSAWTLVPGTDTQPNMQNIVVGRDGSVFFDDLSAGLWRADAQGTTLAIDCHNPEYHDCDIAMDSLTLDGAGSLYYLGCPLTLDHRFAYRIRAGQTQAERLAAIPEAYPYCRSLQAMQDGTLFLVSATSNGTDASGAIFQLELGAPTWEQIAVSDATRRYVVREDRTMFGFGDGFFADGMVMSH